MTLLLSVGLAGHAFAEAAKPSKFSDIIKNYSTDLAMPDTPGLSIVGLNSENVLRPTTPRSLGMAVLQGRDDNGTAKQGFALDFAPVRVFYPAMTKDEYENQPVVARPLWNTQVSLGVGQPLSDADKSTRIGLGLSTLLYRPKTSDPYLSGTYAACLDDALVKRLPTEMPVLKPKPAPGSPEEKTEKDAQAKQTEQEDAAVKACRKDLADTTWNATGLMVGLAISKISGRDSAMVPDATPRGYWVSYSYGFEGIKSLQQSLQFTASWRRLREVIVTDPLDKTKFVAQESRLLGIKLYGKTDPANLFIEVSRKRSTIAGRDTERADLVAFGAEKKVADNLWVTIAMGRKRGGTDANPTYVSTGLKFGYEDKASLGGK
jgi:hypothetical protein